MRMEIGLPEPPKQPFENAREMRPKALAQQGLLKLWLEDHPTHSNEEKLVMELAWARSYAAIFTDLYQAEGNMGVTFRKLVDDCDGSPVCLKKIQDVLDQETGHH